MLNKTSLRKTQGLGAKGEDSVFKREHELEEASEERLRQASESRVQARHEPAEPVRKLRVYWPRDLGRRRWEPSVSARECTQPAADSRNQENGNGTF